MKKIIKFGVAATAVVGVGALIYKGLKKLVEKVEGECCVCYGCDCDLDECCDCCGECDCGCDCECHEGVEAAEEAVSTEDNSDCAEEEKKVEETTEASDAE